VRRENSIFGRTFGPALYGGPLGRAHARLERDNPSVDEKLLAELAGMAAYLADQSENFTGDSNRRRPPNESFSFVEHVWHLADLEREGFGDRIRRLLAEDDPVLPDFDGARIARERDYRSQSLVEGLAAFALARHENLEALLALTDAQRSRGGRQEGVGRVTLRDIPMRMLEHDSSHRKEIEELVLALPSP
jgi:hypothetical protein